MRKANKKNQSGFTLIELLVVIAIIGLLSSLIVSSVNSARVRGRDARRVADMQQIQKALELYYSENRQYPPINAANTGVSGPNPIARWQQLKTRLAPYATLPDQDPLGAQNNFRYYYDADSGNNYQSYGMMLRLESGGNFPTSQNDGGFYSNGGQYYEVGTQPPFCRNKYSGNGGNWWGTQNTVCNGGN